MYSRMYEMELKSKNSKKEAEKLYRLHLLAEKRAYSKSLRKKRLRAELYLIMREHLEKLLGKQDINKTKRNELRKMRRKELNKKV